MAPIRNNSAQILFTSTDYVQALKTVDNAKKAIATVEKGGKVKDFSHYIHAYTNILERANATNDAPKQNKKMENAHKKLVGQLRDLEQPVVKASGKIGIAPPDKELFQRLKVDDERKKTSWEEFKDDLTKDLFWKDKWTWKRVAKYSAGTLVALLAIRQVCSAVSMIPDWLWTVPPAGNQALNNLASTTNTISQAAQGVTQVLGGISNAGRNAAGSTIVLSPQQEGTSILMTVGGANMAGIFVNNFIPNMLPFSLVKPAIIPAFVAGAMCEHYYPGFTQLIVDGVKLVYNDPGQTLADIGTAAHNSCTTTTGYCHQGLEGAGKALNSIKTGLAPAYNIVTGNPKTSIATGGLFGASYGYLYYRGWSHKAAAAVSTAIAIVPSLANAAYQGSPVVRNGVDTISEGAGKVWTLTTTGWHNGTLASAYKETQKGLGKAWTWVKTGGKNGYLATIFNAVTSNPAISLETGALVGALTRYKIVQYPLVAINALGQAMGPRNVPNAVNLRAANGAFYVRVTKIVVPIVVTIAGTFSTYMGLKYARP
jgi:hypothetical protein